MSLGTAETTLTTTCGYSIDPSVPLHKLFIRRMRKGRDLKVIITAKNSQTGTGKTTLAFWLAHQWQQLFSRAAWQAEKHATLYAEEFLEMYRDANPGTVLVMDEAEALDARRSMASKNVDFSHHWMKLRVRQVASILTLPGANALDKRLQELADVWVEVKSRGKAIVHHISINSYQGSNGLRTKKIHNIEWPDVSGHPQMQALNELKQKHIDNGLDEFESEDGESIDPEKARREQLLETAQNMRDNGIKGTRIADVVDKSEAWVYKYTEASDDD